VKNLSLFLILVGLIGITYYFEEIVQVNQRVINTQEKKLIKSDFEITSIETSNYKVLKLNSWKVESLNYPASQTLVRDFLYILSNLSIIGELPLADEGKFFSQTKLDWKLKGKNQDRKYTLGNVSELSGKFYVKVWGKVPKIYLCQDQSKFTQTYTSDLDLGIKKYLRLKSILGGKEDLFIERRLFFHQNIADITSIDFKNRHNRPYHIDLIDNHTKPSKFKNIKYKNMKEIMTYFFEKTLIEKLIVENKNVLSNPIGSLKFNLRNSKVTTAKLFAGLNGKYGKYVKFSSIDYIFKLPDDSTQVFGLHVQDFWNKKFLLNVDFKKIKDFIFKLKIGEGKMYSFRVNDLKSFEIEKLDSAVTSINKNLMNFLFNLIFNLVDFKEADYIEKIEKSEKGQLTLDIFQRKFSISLKPNKIEVIDLSERIKYHFKYNTQQLKEDSLKRIFTVNNK